MVLKELHPDTGLRPRRAPIDSWYAAKGIAKLYRFNNGLGALVVDTGDGKFAFTQVEFGNALLKYAIAKGETQENLTQEQVQEQLDKREGVE